MALVITRRRRRKRTYSISKATRKIFMGLLYIGIASGLIAGVGYLKSVIGIIEITLGGTKIDLSIIPVLVVTAFSVYLLFKAIRYFGVRV